MGSLARSAGRLAALSAYGLKLAVFTTGPSFAVPGAASGHLPVQSLSKQEILLRHRQRRKGLGAVQNAAAGAQARDVALSRGTAVQGGNKYAPIELT